MNMSPRLNDLSTSRTEPLYERRQDILEIVWNNLHPTLI